MWLSSHKGPPLLPPIRSDNRSLCALTRMRQLSEPTHFPAETEREECVLPNFEIQRTLTSRNTSIFTITDKMAAALPNLSSDLVWEIVRESLQRHIFILSCSNWERNCIKRWEENGLNEHLWHRKQQQLPPQDRCCLKWRYPAVSRPP